MTLPRSSVAEADFPSFACAPSLMCFTSLLQAPSYNIHLDPQRFGSKREINPHPIRIEYDLCLFTNGNQKFQQAPSVAQE